MTNTTKLAKGRNACFISQFVKFSWIYQFCEYYTACKTKIDL